MNSKSFKPAWWLPNSHLQTLWAPLFRKKILNIQLIRERVELPDGDFIDLDWTEKNATKPIVLLLHGFEGSVDSHYVKGMLDAIKQQGWVGALMHFRGCSGEPNRLPRMYHSGETTDVAYIVEYLLQQTTMPIATIGFSLGGNVLLKWLGETGSKNPLKAAIAISVPFELHKAVKKLENGLSKIYQKRFINSLQKKLKHKFSSGPLPFCSEFLKLKTLREFDDQITAPLHGFASADEYYSLSSSRAFLSSIQTPTLILHAKDDPFMSEDAIPNQDELPSSVELELSRTGGHIGFISGNLPWKPIYWLEERVPGFLHKHL
jgi:hypothetical protein